MAADAVVVVAGMEGALPSLVGGRDGRAGRRGPHQHRVRRRASRASPRCLSMLASCAAGITVVGIDNGFGAACAVARMLGTTSRAHG